jgi:hypothetical protein
MSAISQLKLFKPSGPTMEVPKHPVYQAADQGPFKCSNCHYFSEPNKCKQKQIIDLRGGRVEPDACCDYFEKK